MIKGGEMKTAQAAKVILKDSVRGLAIDLELIAPKMKSIVLAIDEHVHSVRDDLYLAGLVGVMDDLVADVEECAVRADGLAMAETKAAAPAAPKEKARAA